LGHGIFLLRQDEVIFLIEFKEGIPGYLPQVTIEVGKIAAVPAPEYSLRSFDDLRA
jgi:hypothetical protein